MVSSDNYCVRIRGLPWTATVEEICEFFSGVHIVDGIAGVHMIMDANERPSGVAFITVAAEDDLTNALTKHMKNMGNRYIEVHEAKKSQMDFELRRADPVTISGEGVVRLRGLPFGCSKEEIAHFFSGLEIVANGITLLNDQQMKTAGGAYVQFASPEIAARAMSKDKEKIGHRYIELFKSSTNEVNVALGRIPRLGSTGSMGNGGGGFRRPGPYDRGMNDRFGGGGQQQQPQQQQQQQQQQQWGGGSYGGGYGSPGSRGGGQGNYNRGVYDGGYDDGYGGGGNDGYMNNYGGGGPMMRGGGTRGYAGRGKDYDATGGGSRYGKPRYTTHGVHMRGMPYDSGEQEIMDFFQPSNPTNIEVGKNAEGRPSGEADVEFSTHEEAVEAMKKERHCMKHRYIELFLRSEPSANDMAQSYGGADNSGYGNYGASANGSGGYSNYSGTMSQYGDGSDYNYNANNQQRRMMQGNQNYSAF